MRYLELSVSSIEVCTRKCLHCVLLTISVTLAVSFFQCWMLQAFFDIVYVSGTIVYVWARYILSTLGSSSMCRLSRQASRTVMPVALYHCCFILLIRLPFCILSSLLIIIYISGGRTKGAAGGHAGSADSF